MADSLDLAWCLELDNDGLLDLEINGKINQNLGGSFTNDALNGPTIGSFWDVPPIWHDFNGDGLMDAAAGGTIYQNMGFVDLYDPEYVLVLSGDHIYKMDYSDMLRRHKAANAACTISVMEVPWSEASRFGIMNVDGDDNITEMIESRLAKLK